MKIDQTGATNASLMEQLAEMGHKIARVRIARRIRQTEAALRSGISRSTASLIHKGSPRVSIGQVLRYIDAIAPGKTMDQLLNSKDPAVLFLESDERRQRARGLSQKELKELDF